MHLFACTAGKEVGSAAVVGDRSGGAEVRKLKTALLIPQHFTDGGLERQGPFPPSCWHDFSTDNNPLPKSKFGGRQSGIFR